VEFFLDFFGAFGDIRRFKSVDGEFCPGAKAARVFLFLREGLWRLDERR
jgi:hypothetical protein